MAVSVIAAARAVLVAALPGVNVSYKIPEPLTQRFIRISRAGGPRGRDIDSPRIIVECYASTAAKAADGPRAELDAYAAADALRVAASGGPWAGGWITGWEQNNILDFPDPSQTQHARWQFTGTLYLLT
ncbi:hypothetical protein [Williamsia phyllosphaerae]|uniref:Tail terminator n=1 Tax=Williamsia phyllosphaerae TaxID=885042 RepID=A0ABQ1V6G2_9NOCA|nr:hypothetical protein [Williamsia phyllosphaerae]GGF39121.1 hypothetical protein GCM10007298_38520 [Williamsia phyllosphaerae]